MFATVRPVLLLLAFAAAACFGIIWLIRTGPAKPAADPDPDPIPAAAQVQPPAREPEPVRPPTRPTIPAYKTVDETMREIDLWNAYEKNVIGADRDYLGKVLHLKLTGKILKDDAGYFVGGDVVAPGAMTNAQLARLSPKERDWYRNGYPPNIICRIHPLAANMFATMTPGRMEVIGICKGRRTDPNVWQGFVVELADCIPASQRQP